jgi:hypoxanthine phosphoribosyltransferase
MLPPEVEKVLFTPEEIARTIVRLAGEITAQSPRAPLLLLGILKGALFFTADLARALPADTRTEIDFLAVSSYGSGRRSSGEVRLLKDAGESIEGKHVIIVEDIVDNGLTLHYLQGLLGSRKPASLRSCVLFDKPYNRMTDVPIEYKGLLCPDAFVVGYGLDYQERFRNLPYLAQLREEVFLRENLDAMESA